MYELVKLGVARLSKALGAATMPVVVKPPSQQSSIATDNSRALDVRRVICVYVMSHCYTDSFEPLSHFLRLVMLSNSLHADDALLLDCGACQRYPTMPCALKGLVRFGNTVWQPCLHEPCIHK